MAYKSVFLDMSEAKRNVLARRIQKVVDEFPSKAEAARKCGISDDTLTNLINVRSSPSALVLARLAKAKGYSLDWLLLGIGPQKRSSSVRRGRANIDVTTTPQVLAALKKLVKTGVFGTSTPAVCEEILRQGLRRLETEGWLELPTNDNENTEPLQCARCGHEIPWYAGVRIKSSVTTHLNGCPPSASTKSCNCCSRAGEYNGFGQGGPRLFECPRGCACHD